MGFNFLDKQVEFAGRKTLTDVATGTKTIVDIEPNEGTIYESGTPLNALNMNKLAQKEDVEAALNLKEPIFEKKSAFNKDFGTVADTVCQGNDIRLSDSRKCNNTFDNANTSKINLGLGNIDNTSDVNKPISTATQIALNGKANTSGVYSDLSVGNSDKLGNLTASNFVNINGVQTISGLKTFTDNITLKNGTNYGCKINFGDGDYVHLYEYTDDSLEIKASRLRFSVSNWEFSNAKIPASQISVTANTAFGNATTLQGVLDYIANAFNGINIISSIKANNLDIV